MSIKRLNHERLETQCLDHEDRKLYAPAPTLVVQHVEPEYAMISCARFGCSRDAICSGCAKCGLCCRCQGGE